MIQAVFKPASARPKAARRPAPPAPLSLNVSNTNATKTSETLTLRWHRIHVRKVGTSPTTPSSVQETSETDSPTNAPVCSRADLDLLCLHRAGGGNSVCNRRRVESALNALERLRNIPAQHRRRRRGQRQDCRCPVKVGLLGCSRIPDEEGPQRSSNRTETISTRQWGGSE